MIAAPLSIHRNVLRIRNANASSAARPYDRSGGRVCVVPVRTAIILKTRDPVERMMALQHDIRIEISNFNSVLAGLPDDPMLSPGEVQPIENLGGWPQIRFSIVVLRDVQDALRQRVHIDGFSGGLELIRAYRQRPKQHVQRLVTPAHLDGGLR